MPPTSERILFQVLCSVGQRCWRLKSTAFCDAGVLACPKAFDSDRPLRMPGWVSAGCERGCCGFAPLPFCAAPCARNKGARCCRMIRVTTDPEGQLAQTHFRVLSANPDADLSSGSVGHYCGPAPAADRCRMVSVFPISTCSYSSFSRLCSSSCGHLDLCFKILL